MGVFLSSIEFSRPGEVEAGDNRLLVGREDLRGVADRVFLGLLPTSEPGWGVAAHVLGAGGGTLHAHETMLLMNISSSPNFDELMNLFIQKLMNFCTIFSRISRICCRR